MTLRFRDNGTFRVLQMADIQDGPDVNKDTIRLIEAAVRAADPEAPLGAVLGPAVAQLTPERGVSLAVDVDPYDMM